MKVPGAPSAGVAAVLNLTGTDAAADGWVKAWPCGTDQPPTSTLNVSPGKTSVNMAVIEYSEAGICLTSQHSVELVADLSGWITSDTDFTAIQPDRILDTRVDGSRIAANTERRIQVSGLGGVAPTASIGGLNFTVDRPARAGYLVAYPCGQPSKGSTVNFSGGEIVANFTMVPLDNGAVCVRSSVDLDLALDAYGFANGGGSLNVTTPQRLLDTRDPSWAFGQLPAGGKLILNVAGHGNVAASASAALLTVTVANTRGDGYITVWPCDQSMPLASTINTWPNTFRSNLALVKLAADGSACLRLSTSNGTPLDVVIDTIGDIAGAAARAVKPEIGSIEPPPPPAGSGGASAGDAPPTGVMPYIDRSKIPAPTPGHTGMLLEPARTQVLNRGDGVGAMRTDCTFSHMAFDDPIVAPGRAGASHLHAFYGNTDAYANMTTTSNGATSTCSGGQANNTAYWVPAMIDTATGTPIVSNYNQIYYKTGYNGVAASSVQNFPAGLRMVAGKATSTSPQDISKIWFSCGPLGTPVSSIPNCSSGVPVVMAIQFPQCWDGVNLDSPDHKSHMAYPTPGRGCPATHPVALPEITQHIWYDQPAGGTANWRLSSDMYNGPGGYSSHADWWNGWDPSVSAGWISRCLNNGLDCQMNLMNDGTQLQYTGDS